MLDVLVDLYGVIKYAWKFYREIHPVRRIMGIDSSTGIMIITGNVRLGEYVSRVLSSRELGLENSVVTLLNEAPFAMISGDIITYGEVYHFFRTLYSGKKITSYFSDDVRGISENIQGITQNIVSIGGPLWNSVTKTIINYYSKLYPHLFNISVEIPRVCIVDRRFPDEEIRYKPDFENHGTKMDFGVVAKLPSPNPDETKLKVIVLFGCTTLGVLGSFYAFKRLLYDKTRVYRNLRNEILRLKGRIIRRRDVFFSFITKTLRNGPSTIVNGSMIITDSDGDVLWSQKSS